MLLEKLSNIDLLFLVVYVVISVTQETCIRNEDNGVNHNQRGTDHEDTVVIKVCCNQGTKHWSGNRTK